MKRKPDKYALITAVITVVLLLIARAKAPIDLLLLDRFVPGAGYVQIALAAGLAYWLFGKLQDKANYPRYRNNMWLFFGILFYLQFLIGISGQREFLILGSLHFPVPYIILSGAVFRLKVGFMLILFGATILLSGGAWCSHLCYFGGFDSAACTRPAQPVRISRKVQWSIRLGFLAAAIVVPILLYRLQAPLWVIVSIVCTVLLLECACILLLSRKTSKMIHCTFFCPLGTITALLKYINPRRVVFTPRCTRCMKCVAHCKYGALKRGEVKKGAPDISCTLCGDCISVCKHNGIEYKIVNLQNEKSQRVNLIVITVLYVLFVTIAMA